MSTAGAVPRAGSLTSPVAVCARAGLASSTSMMRRAEADPRVNVTTRFATYATARSVCVM